MPAMPWMEAARTTRFCGTAHERGREAGQIPGRGLPAPLHVIGVWVGEERCLLHAALRHPSCMGGREQQAAARCFTRGTRQSQAHPHVAVEHPLNVHLSTLSLLGGLVRLLQVRSLQ